MEPITTGGLIGLTIAVPIGPIAMLCVSRTLARGCLAGIVTGLGSATVHLVYAGVATAGSGMAMQVMQAQISTLRVIGGALLLWIGVQLFRRTVRPNIAEAGCTLSRDYLSAIGLTLSNPLTITGFVAGIAAFGSAEMSSVPLAGGIALGSSLWYLLLSSFTGVVRQRLTLSVIQTINRGAALLMCAMGIITVLRGF